VWRLLQSHTRTRTRRASRSRLTAGIQIGQVVLSQQLFSYQYSAKCHVLTGTYGLVPRVGSEHPQQIGDDSVNVHK